MTSESRESIPEMPPEIYSENALSEPLKAYNSIQKLLEEVKEKLNKEIDKDLKIKDKKPKQFEFYEEKSVVDFIVNGLSSIKIAESRQNLAPLNNPKNDALSIDIFREDSKNNKNPILDFLSKCLPQQQKPSTHPTQPSIERRRPAQFVR